MMKPIRLRILFAALLVGTLAARSEEVPLKILTFNLRYINSGDLGNRTWTARRDQVAKVIRENQPDVIGLQEAFRSMLDDLAGRVPGYQEIGVGREDGKTKGEYAAILVRTERIKVLESGTFWLSDTPDVPNSMTWKNRVTRVCTWARLLDQANDRQFCHFNSHLDHESQEAREKGVELILQRIGTSLNGLPFVITGDFNADESNGAIVKIKESPLHPVDAWRQLHPDIPLNESGTMSNFTGEIDSGRIDYIFVPREAKILGSEILRGHERGIFPSDHYPVRATVQFGPPAAGR